MDKKTESLLKLLLVILLCVVILQFILILIICTRDYVEYNEKVIQYDTRWSMDSSSFALPSF